MSALRSLAKRLRRLGRGGRIDAARPVGQALACRLALPALRGGRASIIICNYNHAQFLAQAVESALIQGDDIEVIVVDDGSTDASMSVLEPFAERIRVVRLSHQGQRAAYSAGFEHSQGQCVFFLDADDYLLPGAAATVLQHMHKGVARVHFQLMLVDARSRQLGVNIPLKQSSGWLAPQLLRGVFPPSAPGSGNGYRREVLQCLFPLPESVDDKHGADFFLVYGSMFLGDAVAIGYPLGAYRVHAHSAAEPGAQFFFGNAAKLHNRERIVTERIAQFRAWLPERVGRSLELPACLSDFSTTKSIFASRIFQNGYVRGRVRGARYLPMLTRSIWRHAEFSFVRRVGLTSWAAALLALPRSLGYPLARYVVDPTSRANKEFRRAQRG